MKTIPLVAILLLTIPGMLSTAATDSGANYTLANTSVSGAVGIITPATTTTPHGVPYAWLSAHGITSNQDQVENNDPDGDGVPTWKEYFAGTDPNVKSSVFKILSLAPDGTVQWYGTGNGGATNGFSMYRCTNLLAGVWQLVANNLGPSASGTNIWTDPAPPVTPSVFYRTAAP